VSGRLLELPEQWRRLVPPPPLLAARESQPMKVAETGGSGTSSSSLSPYAGGDL